MRDPHDEDVMSLFVDPHEHPVVTASRAPQPRELAGRGLVRRNGFDGSTTVMNSPIASAARGGSRWRWRRAAELARTLKSSAHPGDRTPPAAQAPRRCAPSRPRHPRWQCPPGFPAGTARRASRAGVEVVLGHEDGGRRPCLVIVTISCVVSAASTSAARLSFASLRDTDVMYLISCRILAGVHRSPGLSREQAADVLGRQLRPTARRPRRPAPGRTGRACAPAAPPPSPRWCPAATSR